MIEGQFNSGEKLLFEIDLIAADGEIIPVDALLDTGFTQWLAMNTKDLDNLGWLVVDDEQQMQTAQGETQFNVYLGTLNEA